MQTAERVSHKDLSDNYVFQRSVLAYRKAAELVSGDILEIGTGMGYGMEHLAPRANRYVAIDKYPIEIDREKFPNVEFLNMKVPPLKGIADNSFDFVVTFQVIEHIEDDHRFVSEIHRVLKKGGKLIVTTPNINMSLTRNPWHVREYTIEELDELLGKYFSTVEKNGVFGNEKIMAYYDKNKEGVERITRFDILNLQYRLPRRLLQIPYNILNRLNRKKILKENTGLVAEIKASDYSVAPAKEGCFDLLYIAEK